MNEKENCNQIDAGWLGLANTKFESNGYFYR